MKFQKMIETVFKKLGMRAKFGHFIRFMRHFLGDRGSVCVHQSRHRPKELAIIATTLTTVADQTSTKSQTVAAAEEMSCNMDSVAAASAQTTSNVNGIEWRKSPCR